MKCSSCGADTVTTNYGNETCTASGMPQGKCDREPVTAAAEPDAATETAEPGDGLTYG